MNAVEWMVVVLGIGYFGWVMALILWLDLRGERQRHGALLKAYQDLVTSTGRSKR